MPSINVKKNDAKSKNMSAPVPKLSDVMEQQPKSQQGTASAEKQTSNISVGDKVEKSKLQL